MKTIQLGVHPGPACTAINKAMMTESEKLIPKYAAQALQGKKIVDLTFEELQLVRLLIKHSYLRPSTDWNVGSMTNKAMIREQGPTVVKFSGSNVRVSLPAMAEDGVGTSYVTKGGGRFGSGRFG